MIENIFQIKNNFFYKIIVKFLWVIFILINLSSCIYLNRSQIINKKNSKVLSIVSIDVVYDGKEEKNDNGFLGFCSVRFKDDSGNKVKFLKDNNFFILESEPDRIWLHNMRCAHQKIPIILSRIRIVNFEDFGFIANGNVINYVGHVKINYKPSGFKLSDFFGISVFAKDDSNRVNIEVEDRFYDAKNYINSKFPELRNKTFVKSLLTDPINFKYSLDDKDYNSEENNKENNIIQEESDQNNIPQNINNNSYQENINNNPYKITNSQLPNIPENGAGNVVGIIHEKYFLPQNKNIRSIIHPSGKIMTYPTAAYQDNPYYSPYYNQYYTTSNPQNYFNPYITPYTSTVQDPITQLTNRKIINSK